MKYTQRVYQDLEKEYPDQPEFLQAVKEVFESITEHVEADRRYEDNQLLERLVVPDRIIIFKVPWEDDDGEIQVNTGYRVQFNNALGPYKGGLRFHPSVNLSILKFLGFEQIFKNALTGLPLGGAKGGADFDPGSSSEKEVMRFCRSFMTEFYRHIGADTDVPAGDIGVGTREIGYLFGQYKKITNTFNGVLTGKDTAWGGSQIRQEATGYGLIYFVEEVLKNINDSLEGKRVLISGSGNVAQFAAQGAIKAGAKILAMSDSGGVVIDEQGIDEQKLEWIIRLKNEKRGRMSEYAEKFGATYLEGKKPWGQVQADIALPCATQNEIEKEDATLLIDHGVQLVAEGANMPTTKEAIDTLKKNNIIFVPGKASNAGGVAVSGFEMSQASMRMSWEREEVDQRLRDTMREIHRRCEEGQRVQGADKMRVDYTKGANIAAFKKVAKAIIEQGI